MAGHKRSGQSRRLSGKCQAAAECGCGLIVIGRPCQEEGPDLADTLDYLAERFGIPKTPVQQVTLVGIGMGTRDTITVEGLRAVEEADLLSKRFKIVSSSNLYSFIICF